MNYYNEIKTKLIENENYARIKDYSKEKHRVQTYYQVGKILLSAGKQYGENIIGKYAIKLQEEVGQKYNERTLRSMRQLYRMFNDEIWKPLVSKLTWTNLLVIMSLKNQEEISYYINQCIKLNLSKRKLQEKIKNKEYERLDEETKLKLHHNEEPNILNIIKNPLIVKNKYNKVVLTEKTLKDIIIENLDDFLLELGEKFCYIGNEYKIKIGDRFNYIDLLLYNIKHKCYIVIELKVTELKKAHIGQIKTYMNYIDKNIKSLDEDKTIGIIICKKDNVFLMEYCSDPRILSREYILK